MVVVVYNLLLMGLVRWCRKTDAGVVCRVGGDDFFGIEGVSLLSVLRRQRSGSRFQVGSEQFGRRADFRWKIPNFFYCSLSGIFLR